MLIGEAERRRVGMEQAGVHDPLHALVLRRGDDVVMLDGTLADLAGRDEQQRVDACERLIEHFGFAVICFTRRHPEARRFGVRAHKRYEIRGRYSVLQLFDDKAAELPGRSSDGDGHNSFSLRFVCSQASSETLTVTDQAKKIRLWPVLAQSGAVSGLWSAPAPPQALAPPAHTHCSAPLEYSARPGI